MQYNKNRVDNFIFLNLIISTIISLFFIRYGIKLSPFETLFWVMASISTISTIYLIVYILFRALFRFRFIFIVLSILFFLINILLISDLIIFKIWRFHINSMVLNIISSPSAYDSFEFSPFMYMAVVAIIATLLLLEYLIYRYLPKKAVFGKKILIFLFFIILFEKIFYGIADVKNYTSILESVRTIPLYQPLTFSKLANRLGIKSQKKSITKLSQKSSMVNYPLKEIVIDEKKIDPKNIFIFMFDAVNRTIIDKESAPNIITFSKDAMDFKNHISGGDATRFGIFSFFYGLNSAYWFNFLSAQKEPVLFSTLKKLNYNIAIFSSTSTKWPEFSKTVYCGIKDRVFDSYKGSSYKKDKENMKKFIEFIKSADKSRPIFSFVFLDATHAYSYPKEFEKFKPNAGGNGLNYLSLNRENIDRVKNSFKNALFYDDHLFGKAIDTIKKLGLYSDSIIIFSSDHGEEFFEYGFCGHNSSFSKAQINSPLFIKIPSKGAKTIKRLTSHLDLAPTLLKILGVKNRGSDFSNGYDLFGKDYKREFAFISKWTKSAIYTDEFTYIFSNISNEVRRSDDYTPIDKNRAKRIDQILLKVLKQNREFLK